MEDPEAYQIDEKSEQEKGLHYLSAFCNNYTPASLFHESKAISFQVTHFFYLRHVRKRPYLSFRTSKVYGDTLNDTKVLTIRVLCATPMCFTALQALGMVSKNDEALSVLGHIFASLVLLGMLCSMKRLLFDVTDYLEEVVRDSLNELRASVDHERDFDLSRVRTNSSIDEKGVSDKIEAMMHTKNAIKRWELERTLNRDLMTEEERTRWEFNANHKHPSMLRIFGLVIACVCGVVFIGFGSFCVIIHSASNNWAQWLWFSTAMLGGVLVDAYAVQCLSGEGGDIVFSYLRGFFRSTSRPAGGEEVVEVEVKDEENPVEVVTSPAHVDDVKTEEDEEIELPEIRTQAVSARSVGSGSSQKTVTGQQRKKALALKNKKETKV
ncbi:hypothetical protein TL16_g06916 [Triparma laevis f. inornata]|uniref:Uncharacterized protein n=2 Tax=Triparma laevis TaxID=1534972 RepID=A0A9W6ZPI7_9STRA|nr:hypothetical protein TrLO_g14327 [Triparma laevis f. longispina]GMH75943.1 hypothetical protein TL16_g06916 [Triparma laevis f. inornata]